MQDRNWQKRNLTAAILLRGEEEGRVPFIFAFMVRGLLDPLALIKESEEG